MRSFLGAWLVSLRRTRADWPIVATAALIALLAATLLAAGPIYSAAVAQAGLADAVDAFMEGIAFSGDQTARVFRAATALGLPVKLHADQLSNLGGAALASEFCARPSPSPISTS